MAIRHADWLKQGKRDLEPARRVLDAGDYEWACFAFDILIPLTVFSRSIPAIHETLVGPGGHWRIGAKSRRVESELVLVDREALLAELGRVFDAQTAETLLRVLNKVAAQVRAVGVTREDFGELKQIVAELAEAQRHQVAVLQDGRNPLWEEALEAWAIA